MSSGNGHLPEGAKIITLEQLRAANTKYITLPAASARLGTEVCVRIRAIRRAAYLAMMPPAPPGAETWGAGIEDLKLRAEARNKQHDAWLATLSLAAQLERREVLDNLTYKIAAAGLLEPATTVEQAKDYAEDADVIAVAILDFSGLLEVPAQTPADVPASAPVEPAVP
jgi:hypothetical protein